MAVADVVFGSSMGLWWFRSVVLFNRERWGD